MMFLQTNQSIAEKDKLIAQCSKDITEMDKTILEKDKQIAELRKVASSKETKTHDVTWEVDHSTIQLSKLVGKGAIGEV